MDRRNISPEGTDRQDPSRIGNARTWGGYFIWSVMAAALPLAVDRLVICPALNKNLGPEAFGAFLWVFGLVCIFGSVAANGFSMTLMRDFVNHPVEKANRMAATSVLLTAGISLVLLPLVALASYWWAPLLVRSQAAEFYVPLVLLGVVRGLQLVVNSLLRIQRRFRTIFIMRLIEAALLFGFLLSGSMTSVLVVGIVYLVSVLVPLFVAGWQCREVLSGGYSLQGGTLNYLFVGCAAISLMTVLDQAQVFSPRLVLGTQEEGMAMVASLYAGTSIGNIFVMPIGLMGASVLSLLAGTQSFAFRGRNAWAYAGGCVLLAAVAGGASYVCGGWFVGKLYPDLYAGTISFYHWIALANGCGCVMLMLRPVALKYGMLARVCLVSAIPLATQLTALILVVPRWGAAGAAMAQAISAAVSAGLWLFVFAVMVMKRQAEGETGESLDPVETSVRRLDESADAQQPTAAFTHETHRSRA